MQPMSMGNLEKKAVNRNKSYWRELIAAWQTSNEHQKDFCTRMNIKLGTFAHWRGVFKKENKQKENKFIELKVTPQATYLEQWVIKCPTGHKIIFNSNVDEAKVIFKLLGLII